jgi:glycosyltransferase involved in cell wall biosynthesis
MPIDSPPFHIDPKNESRTVPRPRLLMIAYCFAPLGSMEERNGWQRALLAARTMDVTVFYVPKVPLDELFKSLPEWLPTGALKFEPVEESLMCQLLKKLDSTFYITYRLWHWKVFQRAKKMHQESPFSGSHLVTLCGYREPGYVWRIDIPHIWGPLGGTHNFPEAFMNSIQSWSRLRERIRTAINRFQLNRSGRIRRAILQSAAVVAASSGARSDFESGFGIQCDVELETGIDHPLRPLRQARNSSQPLRILWTGRLREWKGLPILLHSIASLPNTVSVQVRIVGNGSSKTNWMNLASKLGIADQIEWIPWPTYQETLEYYSWADVFAFTSLRDTSGTGLLEALAAGCPILGLDHQGAKDIMTSECAIPIPTDSWHSAVSGYRDGILRLATDSNEWLRLSHGASQRAKAYVWEGRSDCIDANYRKYILGPATPANA